MNTTILARLAASVPIKDGLPGNIQWMPPGRHTITALKAGKPATMTVNVTPEVAARMNGVLQQLRAKAANGTEDLPYFDLNHDDNGASGYPTEFYWQGNDRTSGGVRAKLEWTDLGKQAIAGKIYRRFSPAFGLDASGAIQASGVNMGGFVNRAAFKTIEPLFATDGSGVSTGIHAWWDLYIKEKQKLYDAQDAILQPLTDKRAILEKQLNSMPPADRGPIAAQIAEVEAQINDLDEADEQEAWDAAVQADPSGFKDFLDYLEQQQPGSKARLMQAVSGESANEAFSVRCRESTSFYAFYCACLGYGAAEDFAAPTRVGELPFMRGAKFLAKRDGIAIANACEVLAKHSPESYEQYREQLGQCPVDIVLDTQTAHVLAKAREIPFQGGDLVTAKPDDQKPDPEKAEQDASSAYEQWRKENLLHGR